MISKTLTYLDFNGDKHKKEFWFHLSVPEITKLQFQDKDQTMFDAIVKMTEEENARDVLDLLETIVRASVGQRSEDGARFTKNDDVRSELFDTEAYSVLFEQLLQDPDEVARFLQGVLPKSLSEKTQSKVKLEELSGLSKDELLKRFDEMK